MFGLNFNDSNTYFGIIGIIALLFSIWQYYKTKTETRLTLYIQELIPIISESLGVFKNLQIKVIENKIPVSAEVYHLRFFLKNTGNVDIPKQKIFEQIKISLPPEIHILDYSIQAYPSNVSQQTFLDLSKNEFSSSFQLLKKDELIQFDTIVHIPQNVKNEKKLQNFFSLQNFVTGNMIIKGRIENCKKMDYARIKKETPKKTYVNAILSIFIGLLIFSSLFIYMTTPVRITISQMKTIGYYDSIYTGYIDFVKGDSLKIIVPGKNRTFLISHEDFHKGSGYVYPHKRKILKEVIFMLGGFFLLFSLLIYMEVKKGRNKKSIMDFIDKIET